MAENQFFPCSHFYSSPYDPQLWVSPGASSIQTFSDDSSYSDYPNDLIYDDDESFSNLEISNWYIDDLMDQLSCLQKLKNQSVKRYIQEAKSLIYALESAGGLRI